MELFKTISLNIFCFFLLLAIFTRAYSRRDRWLLQNRLFIWLIVSNMVMLVIDSLCWVFEGGSQPSLNILFNTLLYTFMPLPVAIWIVYTNYQVFHDNKRMFNLFYPLVALIIINAAISISSPWTGWFFQVDVNNHYHRGPYFLYHAGLAYAMLLYSFLFIHFYQPLIEKRYFNTLLYFFLPQMLFSTMQIAFYGLALNWVGMAFSILVVYINIQDSALRRDYLTGAYNRRMLDEYLTDISNAPQAETIAAMMIDLDDFKAINDNYGHATGDEALQNTVILLRKCIHSEDIIIRYGGDEFLLLMKLNDPQALEATAARIKQEIEQFNLSSNCVYKLGLSMGYALFDPQSGMTISAFLKHIDSLMYEQKNEKAMNASFSQA